MTYTESKKLLDEIRNRNEMMFRMAISHLMDVGIRNLDDAGIRLTCNAINKEDDHNHIMTNAFKCDLIKTAGELAKIDHIHLLVYIQKEIVYDVGQDEEEKLMTLYEYIQNSADEEITVWDKNYDIETYFYGNDEKDAWDKAMNDIAKCLSVVEFRNGGVVVNLSEVIENKLPEFKNADLFKNCYIDDIMNDIGSIFAGHVSEEWLTIFADVLADNVDWKN